MPPTPQDRIVRKEVALGVIREMEPPEEHIGIRLLAPWMDVESDDVIFDYTQGLTTGLAPARAEDAESELAQKDETVGTGRASIIDWALKDHYDPSDVSRYRELLTLTGLQNVDAPLTGRMNEAFAAKVARDTARRRRKLDNRFEWLIWQAMENSVITYNDGRIKFTVDFGRPGSQTDDDVTGGGGDYWTEAASDPIGDLLARKHAARDLYGINLNRAVTSERVIWQMMNSSRFTNSLTGDNPLYTVPGWGVEMARQRIEAATGINFTVYDSVYRTRPLGSTVPVNNRFFSENKVLLLPSEGDIAEIDDAIGFGRTLSSPHPEGDWSSGFYEWERDTVDPWSHDIGTGCKAFPVFPHLEYTWTMVVMAAA